MFSPNQLYDYLRYYCRGNKKNVEILHFLDLGSKDLQDLVHATTPYIAENLQTDLSHTELKKHHRETGGTMVMFDQEPLDIHTYCMVSKENIKQDNAIANKHINLADDDFFLYRSKGIYNPIIAVSEINSNDIARVTDNFHIPFYFWSNAFLSRYWYSMYEMLSPINNDNKNKFGCYIRDVTGTRKYRKNILQMLANSTIDVYCPILDNRNIELPSELSATIDWQDQSKFDIHIVPETIFNTEKVHLTEKIFKPIVMYQPFILFGGARSLEYLRSYGFKTFGDLWDESYDYEEDADIRFKKITDLISYLNNLNPTDYKKLIQQTNNIAKFNREHFYSDKFYKTLKNELHKNLKEALQLREEQFYTNPGGTLFYFDNLYLNEFGVKPRRGVDHKKALEYAYSKSKSVGDAIVKKYSHLL
jgi:hypothetical protein